MFLNYIDQILVSFFLLVILYVGIANTKKIENINAFATGKRSFSTFSLWATVTATWVSGSGFAITLSGVYSKGLAYYIPSLFMSGCLLLLALVIIPRMGKFFGKTSVATAMREEYGNAVGNITAICGFIGVSGSVAIQFKVLANVANFFFGIEPTIALLFMAGITIFYTVWGGIRSVVQTDIVQLICFSIALPIVMVFLGYNVDFEKIPSLLEVDKFNIFKISTTTDFCWIEFILLAIYFATPSLQPPDFQRISMGCSVKQSQDSYFYSAIAIFIVKFVLVVFPLAIYLMNPNLEKQQLLGFLIDNFSFPVIKAILGIGIICMAMSTADSYLNIGSILIANDFWIFNRKNPVERLFNTRWCVVVLGILAIFLALSQADLLQIILLSLSFYTPIVSVPLLLLVFGYKTTNRCCIAGMFVGFIIIFKTKIIDGTSLNITPFAMVANYLVFWAGHYTVEKWEWFKRFGITSKLHEIKYIA